jgi:hypothetical protein
MPRVNRSIKFSLSSRLTSVQKQHEGQQTPSPDERITSQSKKVNADTVVEFNNVKMSLEVNAYHEDKGSLYFLKVLDELYEAAAASGDANAMFTDDVKIYAETSIMKLH